MGIKKYTDSVRAIGYLGGETGFCESLVITLGKTGKEKYVLHRMNLGATRDMETIDGHVKIEFESESSLLESWRNIERNLSTYFIDEKFRWSKTSANCGYNIEERVNPLWQNLIPKAS